jgi:DnaK suppressor protein
MTHSIAETYRAKLLRLQDRLVSELDDLEVEPPLATHTPVRVEMEPGDRGDRSVEVYEEQVNLSLVMNEAALLREVSDALERFDQGCFGRCETCDRAIEPARLDAVPYTRTCGECARKHAPRG